jgi:hypothetical protein
MSKVGDLVVTLLAPAAKAASQPLQRLYEELADRERAALLRQIEERERPERLQAESEYYGIPTDLIAELDAQGIPWRRVIDAGKWRDLTP